MLSHYWTHCQRILEINENLYCDFGVNGSWDIFDQYDNINVIKLTWDFKFKPYLDCIIKIFKARFCARVDQQLDTLKTIETYAPVVQYTTVILMLTLDMFLGLKSKQGYVNSDLLHTNIEEGENFYINMPKGF